LIAIVWNWELLWVILEVSVGLGAVIFVHELGHFLVAKACGVRCEKFYIGFDIGGWKISRQWGETEYGIGILPLGGYVKMLGQDDNPSKIAEEMERSRIAREVPAGDVSGADSDGEVSESTETQYILDPRSYLAKSVPQRMAIISAGVVMNLIIAVIFAAVAYGMGVPYRAPVVSDVVPGSPAWRAGLQAGDEIIRIGDLENPRFSDLQGRVALGDLSHGVPLVVRRADGSAPISVNLRPEKGRGLVPTIGIVSASTLTVGGVLPHSAAARATPKLKPGDQIVAVDQTRVARQAELIRQLIAHRDRAIELTVRRPAEPRPGRPSDDVDRAAKELNITLPRAPMRRVGLVMEMGPITAIKTDSPAAAAGLREGDRIVEADGQPVGDPIAWPLQISQRVGKTISVKILRGEGAGATTLQMDLVAGPAHSFESVRITNGPIAVPEFGLAYQVENRIAAVLPGSPAAKAGIAPGAEVKEARLVPADREEPSAEASRMVNELTPFPFDAQNHNWPLVLESLQALPPGIQLRLRLATGDAIRQVDLAPRPSGDQYLVRRGLILEPLERVRRAATTRQAVDLGLEETKESVLMVYRFLQKLGGQVSIRAMGGPVSIAKAAGMSAFEGPSKLLIFLTMLSANLAVINFLPIPLLDGGHMVFLILEGILRRPVSEKIIIAFHTIGFVLIITLMLFVLALDVGLIPRG